MPFRGTHDQVTRDRISARLKGHPVSERTRQRIREAKTGVPLSAEHRAAISRAKRLRWISRETPAPFCTRGVSAANEQKP